ncbi:xyloside xylosyltransferase 1 isoform X3 [Bacillus rossius redtenbacheri]|uniref:xyloside xylosyltransferase 1 isoform X3 n=1 Tax=Bacillus rossius redtenbacheri TaxID=93214 RepID=UPI002FDE4DD6
MVAVVVSRRIVWLCSGLAYIYSLFMMSQQCGVKKHYKTTFNKLYAEEFLHIILSRKGENYAYCVACRFDFSLAHAGRNDVFKHSQTKKHVASVKCIDSNKKLNFVSDTSENHIIRAECLFTSFIVEHNLPITCADHVCSLFRKMFPGSEIAKKYSCARTQTSAIIAEMEEETHAANVKILKSEVFSVATDGSNQGYAKLYPIVVTFYNKETSAMVTYYDAGRLAHQLTDIVTAMQPHFSSQPGTYYSDALFFLSLGLHHIAANQSRAAMFDADTKLLADVAELFRHFDSFNNTTLFGVAPELTPVYRHVLYVYRSKHKNTRFGEPFSKGGFPGINSGVMLLHLDHMRNSQKYNELLKPASVDELAAKYHFQGHLGDQDFYTLLAMEHPEMIHLLPCGWNRQLCTWWRDHGYQEVFTAFFRCADTVRLYHGNCNTPMPTS